MDEKRIMLINRLTKNYRKLSSRLKALTLDAYRLYDRDLPEYPYQVDLYGQYGVCWEKGNPLHGTDERKKRAENDFSEILTAAPFALKKVFFKHRRSQDCGAQYQKEGEEQLTTIIHEHQARFLVNLSDYLDVGLFLDHRPTRQWIYRDIQAGQKFLNLFCYTGSASVFAALKGARTTNVDLSHNYLAWAEKNFEINQLRPSGHEFLRMSALDFIQQVPTKTYDFIFLDPPTFSNSKRMQHDFEVERDQVPLIRSTTQLLKPGGQMIFSTNKRSFKLDEQLKEEFVIKDMTVASIPFDYRDQKIHQCFRISG